MYDGLARLPAFNPDDDGDRVPREVAELREEIAAADAVLFCTPEYAGTLPGSFKNLLDWTVGGGQLYGKPAAWINVAAPGRGQGAQDALAAVLGYVGAVIVEAACRRIPVDRAAVSQDGTISDPRFKAEAAQVWGALLDFLGGRQPPRPSSHKVHGQTLLIRNTWCTVHGSASKTAYTALSSAASTASSAMSSTSPLAIGPPRMTNPRATS